MGTGERFAKGVDWRGADIAEDDADGSNHQLGKRTLDVMAALLVAGSDFCGTGGGNVHTIMALTTPNGAARRTSTAKNALQSSQAIAIGPPLSQFGANSSCASECRKKSRFMNIASA